MGGETVDVPITLSGNSGICGANIVISYDKNLQLTGITKGSALSSLSMTKPGSIASNPFAVVWDGMEADSTNGTIAVLTFKTPSNAGKYSINVSYDEGDIVDGTLSPVNVTLKTEVSLLKILHLFRVRQLQLALSQQSWEKASLFL